MELTVRADVSEGKTNPCICFPAVLHLLEGPREAETGLGPSLKDLAQLREEVCDDGKMGTLLWENGCSGRLERFLCQKCSKTRAEYPNKMMGI